MTNKSTPGPWSKDSNGWVYQADIWENQDLVLATPELLEALNACLSWMESTRECGDCGNWEWDEGSVYKTGLAVLAKATGEQA